MPSIKLHVIFLYYTVHIYPSPCLVLGRQKTHRQKVMQKVILIVMPKARRLWAFVNWTFYVVWITTCLLISCRRRRVVGHPLPTVYMLTALILSQRRVSSSRANRPRIPFGARCRGQVEMMWSAVCSVAPHSQFGEGATPHLYKDEWNRLRQYADDSVLPKMFWANPFQET